MENRQRTPLALAIEEIKKNGWINNNDRTVVLSILESLKPKERQMLESAYNGAIKARYTNGMIDLKIVKIARLPETFERYYNDNLTQE